MSTSGQRAFLYAKIHPKHKKIVELKMKKKGIHSVIDKTLPKVGKK